VIPEQRLLALREEEHELVDAAIEIVEEVRADMKQRGSRSFVTKNYD
jgi:hypothetical protein